MSARTTGCNNCLSLSGLVLSLLLWGCMGDGGQGGATLVPIPGGDAAPLSAAKNGFHEQEFAKNPNLKVQMGHVVVTSLEPPSSAGKQSADSGVAGIDAIPVQLKTAGTYTFMLQIDPRHFLRLVDIANNEMIRLAGNGTSSVALAAGDYLLELHSGAKPGEPPDNIFIQLGSSQKAAAQVQQDSRKKIAAAVQPSATGDPQSNLQIILNGGSCAGCNLRGIDVSSNCNGEAAPAGCGPSWNQGASNWNNTNLSGADLTGANLSNGTLVGTKLTGAIMQNANLAGVEMGTAILDSANLSGASLAGSDASEGVSANNTNFSGVDFRGATLNFNSAQGANFQNTQLGCWSNSDTDWQGNASCAFYRGSLAGANLTGAILTNFQWSLANYIFLSTDLSGAIWTDGGYCMKGSTGVCNELKVNGCAVGIPPKGSTCVSDGTLLSSAIPSPYQGVKLDGVPLKNANLAGNNLSGISLRGADLSNSLLGCPYNNDPVFGNLVTITNNQALPSVLVPPPCLWTGKSQLPVTNLTNADLTGANLSGANLNLVNLTGAILQGANLSNAYLTNNQQVDPTQTFVNAGAPMNLAGINLSNANLRGTNLAGDNLSNANLSGADLTGATLTGATLTGANFSGATWTDGHKCASSGPLGSCN